VVLEEGGFSACGASVLVGTLSDGDRATLRGVEPVQVSDAGSSSVEALGARSKEAECKVGASSASISLALGTSRKVIELC